MIEQLASRRERLQDDTRSEIKRLARQQMAQEGTAAISLRAIARQMGLTAPALYRYYANRDDLITALILDAYNASADALEAARDALPADAHAQRLLATVLAYRQWALDHPADYVLILGNPIPGYKAPANLTMPAARRTMTLFIDLLEAARQAGVLTYPPEYTELYPQVQQQIVGGPPRYGSAMPQPALGLVLVIWGELHGLISLELFHHLQPIIADPGALYRFQFVALLRRMGLHIDM